MIFTRNCGTGRPHVGLCPAHLVFTSFYSFFVFQFVFVFYIRVLPEWRINILYSVTPCHLLGLSGIKLIKSKIVRQSEIKRITLQCESKKIPPWVFLHFFRKRLGFFSPSFTHLLHVPIYARLEIFNQLSPIMTKLCHIKCDHPACVSTDGGRFENIMVVALNMT